MLTVYKYYRSMSMMMMVLVGPAFDVLTSEGGFGLASTVESDGVTDLTSFSSGLLLLACRDESLLYLHR